MLFKYELSVWLKDIAYFYLFDEVPFNSIAYFFG